MPRVFTDRPTELPNGLLVGGEYVTTYRDGKSPCDGVSNDAVFINRVLAAGRRVSLDPAKTYYVNSPIIYPVDGVGIEGNGATIIIGHAAGQFDNDDYSDIYSVTNTGGNKYAVAFYAIGRARPFLRNARIIYTWTEYRTLSPVRWVNCTDIDISGCEFTGFCRGQVISVSGCAGGKINDNYIHHCYTNSKFDPDGVTNATSSEVQVTAISVDDGGTAGSSDLEIAHNRIEWITVGNAVLFQQGYQADGISIQGPGTSATKPSLRINVHSNHINHTGDGVDCFGRDCTIANNTFSWCFNSFLKLVHGASFCKVHGNTGKEASYCGFLFGGSTSATAMYGDNEVFDNTFQNVNRAYEDDGTTPLVWLNADGNPTYTPAVAGETWWSDEFNGGVGATTAGVRIDVRSEVTPFPGPVDTFQHNNCRFYDNQFTLGGNADFGFFCEAITYRDPLTHYLRGNFVSGFEDGLIGDTAGRFISLDRVVTLPVAPSANQNNYDPTNFGRFMEQQVVLDVAATQPIKITGLAQGRAGRVVTIENASANYPLWLEHDSTSSTAANRFVLPSSFPAFLFPGDSITLFYDGVASRWRVLYWPQQGEGMGFSMFDDFLSVANFGAAVHGQAGRFAAGTTGTASAINPTNVGVTTTEKGMGVLSLSTGTDTNGRAVLGMERGNAGNQIVPEQGPAGLIARVLRGTANDGTNTYTLVAGFTDGNGGTWTDGAAWELRWTGSAEEWSQTTTAAGSATRRNTSSPTVDTTFVWLGVFLNADWSEAYFIWSQDSKSFTYAGSINTNLPGTADLVAAGVYIQKSAGTTARTANVDLLGVRVEMGARG